MVKLTLAQMKTIDGRMRRGQHAKSTGCVKATFRIAEDIPSDLRHGVFVQPGRSFECLIRFSNAQSTFEGDGQGTVRGMAIKLLEVDGAQAIEGNDNRTQDFLLVDHPVFLFPTPQAYLDTIRRKNIPLVGNLIAGAHFAIFERDQLGILKAMQGKRVASPLEITYWSGSPYWLGSADGQVGHAVKYSAIPRDTPTAPPEHPEDKPKDYLRQALKDHLAKREAVFNFRIQKQTDAEAMPIEDLTMPWDEKVSNPIQVATLHVGQQVVSPDSEVEQRCESLAFNPWHTLVEHRPLGGMNRLRRAVYEAGFKQRI
jgi:hypothetical protein